MNKNPEQLIARFVAGETLSSAEYQTLRDLLTNDPGLVQQINDDRAIDAILRSDSLSDEQFVAKCVNRYRQLDLDLPHQLDSAKVTRSPLPTNNNLSSFRDRQHQRLSDSDIDLDSPTSGLPSTVSGNAPSGFAPNITSAPFDSAPFTSAASAHNPSHDADAVETGTEGVEVTQADGLETESIRSASVRKTVGFSRAVLFAAIAATLLALITAGIWLSPTETDSGVASSESDPANVDSSQDAIVAIPDASDANQKAPQIVTDESNAETPPDPGNVREQIVNSQGNGLVEKESDDVVQPDTVSPVLPTGFATIYPGKAIWEKLPWKEGVDFSSGVAVNNVRLELQSGAARVEFDNGARLDLLGQCRGEIIAERTIVLESGVFMLSVPATLENFSVRAGATNLFASDELNAQVVIDGQGVLETYLFDGKLSLLRSGAPADTAIQLSKDGLQHVVMSPELGRSEFPSITMARGGNRFFVGQLGTEKSFLKVDSPPIFAQLTNQLVPSATKPGDSAQTELERQFEELFQGFAGTEDDQQGMSVPSPSADGNADAQQFSGTIIYNGTTQKFDSLKTYTEAIGEQFELLNFRSPQSPLRLKSQSAEDFDLGFDINGMTLKFSDLKLLEQRREKMEEESPSSYR